MTITRPGSAQLLPQIDTEGAEALVLGGARELLASGRVRNMVVEITSAHWLCAPSCITHTLT